MLNEISIILFRGWYKNKSICWIPSPLYWTFLHFFLTWSMVDVCPVFVVWRSVVEVDDDFIPSSDELRKLNQALEFTKISFSRVDSFFFKYLSSIWLLFCLSSPQLFKFLLFYLFDKFRLHQKTSSGLFTLWS